LLLGGYVLGGLSAEERHLFTMHLHGCPRCREELADAAPLPALLHKVPGVPGTPTPAAGDAPALAALLSTVRSQRRRQRVAPPGGHRRGGRRRGRGRLPPPPR